MLNEDTPKPASNPAAAAYMCGPANMSGGQSPTKATIPAGTTQVQVVFKSTTDGNWYQACGGAKVDSLKNGDTIGGSWQAPNGQGACPVS